MNIENKLSLFRSEMKEKNISAYIVEGSDPHQSEYIAERWNGRAWISGFTGSAGTIIITNAHAGLWTDSRYYIQAKKELQHSSFQMHKSLASSSYQYIDWLLDNLEENTTVGIDGWCVSHAVYIQYQKKLKKRNITLQLEYDIFNSIWDNRPSIPEETIFEHDSKYTGFSRKEKIAQLRTEMLSVSADSYFVPALDDIAWTLNLRGRDIPCNPVFMSYLLIRKEISLLYIPKGKISAPLKISLHEAGILIKDYHEIRKDLNELQSGERIAVDLSQINSILYSSINADIVAIKSFAKYKKAIKNDVEVAHIHKAMENDGASLAETFFTLFKSNKSFTEYQVTELLKSKRKLQDHYYGESFSAIVGYKENGAIVHYRPSETESKKIEGRGLLLVDSGGQYHNGTTDITRVFTMGKPTEEERKHYTLVLKGMIALTLASFPSGTTGGQLEVLARQYLWKNKLDFGHGTGHGVGFFLNVHEPPQGFASINSERGKTPLSIGMLTSNEPGYYLEGHYGIRLENLILVVPEENDFLSFKTMTLYPFQHELIDKDLLTTSEINWLNFYHNEVKERVSPCIEDPSIKAWFEDQCRSF